MTRPYTSSDRRCIAQAYNIIERVAEQHGSWGAPMRLHDALRYERDHRSDIAVARALAVREFRRGYTDGKENAGELWLLSPGLMHFYLFGAFLRKHYRGIVNRTELKTLGYAVERHDNSIKERLDAIK